MKCDVIYAMVCACCWGLLCIGCTKEDFVFSGNGGGGEVEGENGGEMVPPMVSSDAASFFNFAIFFDGADRENYGNVVEEVEAGNPDFPENHEFVHQVTLTYSASGVDYSELPQGVHMGFNCIFIMIMCFFSCALVTYIARDIFITNFVSPPFTPFMIIKKSQ